MIEATYTEILQITGLLGLFFGFLLADILIYIVIYFRKHWPRLLD